ncbi:MAG TPA: hypothetical protein VEV84_02120 [Pyrinomonadaceae bacterium]|nr:hypothetical protein [Pyrinomonadaceae bacterium]
MKIALLLLLISVCSAGIYSQSTTGSVGIQDVYLAKDDGTGKAGEAATVFRPNDVPIYCVVQLDSTDSVTVKMNLIAENVPGVKAETKVVSTSYTTKNGQNRVDFNGRPSGKWTVGRYRAEIFIDGKLSKNLAFDIKESASTSNSIKAFQPQKRTSRTTTKSKKNPYTSTARVIDR